MTTLVLTSLGELAAVRDRFPAAPTSRPASGRDARPPVPRERALVPAPPDPAAAVAALVETATALLAELRAVGDAVAAERAAVVRAERQRLDADAERVAALGARLLAARAEAGALAADAVAPAVRARAAALVRACDTLATAAIVEAPRLRAAAAAIAPGPATGSDDGRADAPRVAPADQTGADQTPAEQSRADQTQAAEAALRDGRRLHRRAPVAALDRLEPLELEGVAPELARHCYGLWLTACRRLGLLAAIHLRAGRGRGAVLIPTADGDWEVISAIGLRRWPRGRRVAARSLRGARPLG